MAGSKDSSGQRVCEPVVCARCMEKFNSFVSFVKFAATVSSWKYLKTSSRNAVRHFRKAVQVRVVLQEPDVQVSVGEWVRQ